MAPPLGSVRHQIQKKPDQCLPFPPVQIPTAPRPRHPTVVISRSAMGGEGGAAAATRILRASVAAFANRYHSLTSIAALLLHSSAATLLSQALISRSPPAPPLLQAISSRLHSLFLAAHFPTTARFFSLLSAKLTQTIFSSLLTLPFALTFLLLGKAAVIRAILGRGGGGGGYRSILLTYLVGGVLILSANATFFALLFIVFNAADLLGLSNHSFLFHLLSAAAAVLYSVAIGNITVTCNMAVVIAAREGRAGLLPVVKAGLLIRGRTMTALGLALPANLGMAAVEALFQYRVVRQFNLGREFTSSLLWETLSIAYLHALVGVLDVVVSCMFFMSCSRDCCSNWGRSQDCGAELDLEEKVYLRI